MTDVLIIMGSQSDASTVKHAVELLDKLGVKHEDHIASAHRAPEHVAALVKEAESRGIKVIIAAAGKAAALPGAVSSHTCVLPIYDIAVEGRNDLDNLAAMLGIADMPPGVSAPLCGLGKGGATDAALEAAKVVGLGRPEVQERLRNHRREETKNAALVAPTTPKPKLEGGE